MAGYTVQERIGIGGMGEVYKAFHPGLNRVAAIKILYQKDLAERFKNEAYIQSSVSHPNIARLYEYILSGDHPCIIMEYVEGMTLDNYIMRKGRINNEETEKILMQIASALSYLHERDIIHRDLKSQNFKIQKDGMVKMLDFGISKNKYTPKLTQQGFVIGTTEYMAPEQFQNEVQKKSDIWSLGVLTYEMLTGHMPFDASNPIVLRARIAKGNFTDPKILVPQISDKLSTIIEKSLRINPSSRLSAKGIEDLLGGKNQVKRISRNITIKLPTKNSLSLVVAGIVAVALVIILLVNKSPDKVDPNNHGPVKEKKQVVVKAHKLKIKVPSIEDAVLVFPDGTQRPAPYETSGNEGEVLEFVIRARGYEEKPVRLEFSPRRTTYEYKLDKIKQ
jgi:serine/threonine-protein kinase